jgi:hypothetical protein
MQTLLNGVTQQTTSQIINVEGLHTITCNGLIDYKQFLNFYISVDNENFVLFKIVNLKENVFNIYVGSSKIYVTFETELTENQPIFVNVS